MFDSVFHWIGTIPLEGPTRALVIIGIMFGFSAALNGIWEIVFTVAGWLRGMQARPRSH